jgi:hypothetical protein
MDLTHLALVLRGDIDARYEGPRAGGPSGDEIMNLDNYVVYLRDPLTGEVDWNDGPTSDASSESTRDA